MATFGPYSAICYGLTLSAVTVYSVRSWYAPTFNDLVFPSDVASCSNAALRNCTASSADGSDICRTMSTCTTADQTTTQRATDRQQRGQRTGCHDTDQRSGLNARAEWPVAPNTGGGASPSQTA